MDNIPSTIKVKTNKQQAYFYNQDEYDTAKNQNIVSYLQSIGYELVPEGNYFRGKFHSSLVINGENGAWNWNSQDLAGYSPIELLKQILIYDYAYMEQDAFISAVKRLAGTEGVLSDVTFQPNKTPTKELPKEITKEIKLPESSKNYNRAIAYLCQTRGIDYDIVKEMILDKKIFQTKQYNNICIVSYDENQNPKHAFLRGTMTDPDKKFAGDVTNSNKSYGFIPTENKDSNRIYCFEASIDALSHATIYKLEGLNHKNDTRISLHSTSFLALEKYLEDNPHITEIVSCFDNDKTGHKRSNKMYDEYTERGYEVLRQIPTNKDFNDDLIEYKDDINKINILDDSNIDIEI